MLILREASLYKSSYQEETAQTIGWIDKILLTHKNPRILCYEKGEKLMDKVKSDRVIVTTNTTSQAVHTLHHLLQKS